jgi:hypothetical protein
MHVFFGDAIFVKKAEQKIQLHLNLTKVAMTGINGHSPATKPANQHNPNPKLQIPNPLSLPAWKD